jgi:hypothetical protein
MKYPTLRYGNPNELAFYAHGRPIKDLARQLRRSERSIRNYLSHAEKMPWWIPEILRLQKMEHDAMLKEMGMQPLRTQLGLVSTEAKIIPISPRPLSTPMPSVAIVHIESPAKQQA